LAEISQRIKESVQFEVALLRRLQNWDVVIGFSPKGEEILVCQLGFGSGFGW
jgi:hypothetical protein